NCWKATKIMPKTSNPMESESDNELQEETTNDDNDVVDILLGELSTETDLVV
ncbi:445_t:CDS:1, partial [Dentiscutata erythropus]